MFENLADLSFQRTRKQAVGFYLATMLGSGFLAAAIVMAYLRLSGVQMPQGRDLSGGIEVIQNMEKSVVPIVVFFISTALAVLVARAKGVYDRVTIICIFLAAILSIIGAIFSLIPVAYLTTLPKKAVS
jgi:hypothetical protein